ncbi:TPA: hypothetical protein QCQ83_004023 [Bacillus cereus]|nr:hypothetical protein TUN_32810 [Bacillus sp. M21]HDR4605111.1 hypothetical protein [Bacillus cereus]HDR4633691.1 hypothetical protein [Bacillus cereus]
MILNHPALNLRPFMVIYDIVVPKDNMLRQFNEMGDFSFVFEALKDKYSLDDVHNMQYHLFVFSNIYC